MDVRLTPTPDNDTAAAVIAAIASLLEQDQAEDLPEAGLQRSTWQTAAALAAQRLPPTRDATRARWAAAERVDREARWSYGIVGI